MAGKFVMIGMWQRGVWCVALAGMLGVPLGIPWGAVGTAWGAEPIEIHIRDHRFHPDRVVIPAGRKTILRVINDDPEPEEFESYELNREKIVRPGRHIKIFLPPLKPGTYPFFGEFHPKTAQGLIVVE